jgi:16S rRNA (cytidine1402-2'-O)-methyltransferase
MNNECGTLYLVSTPIGNLSDLTFRALEILKTVDFILCEDTRHSIKLLNHYDIKKPLISYHKFNEVSMTDQIIERLRGGESAALISDAGTPLISDPGNILIAALIEQDIPFFVLPGANALLPALLLSGFDLSGFVFLGFLPKKNTEREAVLHSICDTPLPHVIYVSPHELKELLEQVDSIMPERNLSLSKEITKLHENTLRGTASEILDALDERIRGEFVLVIDRAQKQTVSADINDFSQDELREYYLRFFAETNDKKEAIKQMAKSLGIPKRDLYKTISEADWD